MTGVTVGLAARKAAATQTRTGTLTESEGQAARATDGRGMTATGSAGLRPGQPE